MDTCTKTIVCDKLESDNDYKLTVVQLKEKLRALARDESDREQEIVTSKFSVYVVGLLGLSYAKCGEY